MKPKAGTLKRSVKLINFQVDWSKRKQEGTMKKRKRKLEVWLKQTR